jgi:hypothetical protein
MKKILFAILALSVISCEKQNSELKNDLKSDLVFQSVSIVTEGHANGDITAAATLVGPNLCYKFTHFEVSNTRQNQFDIYAKGDVPAPSQICAQALYQKDTTVSIARPAPGTYVLNFWNPGDKLFKSETVTVN